MKWLFSSLNVLFVSGAAVAWMISQTPPAPLPENALFTLQGHKADVWSVAFHPQGRLLASADANGVVILWDASSGKEKARYQFEGALTTVAVTLVAWGADGKTLYAAGPTGIQRWNLEAGAKLPEWRDPVGASSGGACSRVFSRDGRFFAAAKGDGIRVWDVATGNKLFEHHDKAYRSIDAVVFRSDNKSLLFGGERIIKERDFSSEAGFIDSMDLETAKVQAIYQGKNRLWKIEALAFVSAKRALMFVEGSQVSVLDLERNQVERVRTDIFPRLAIRADGLAFAVGGGSVTSISLYPMATKKEGPSLRGHTDAIKALAFSPDGNLLATGSFDRTVKLWDVANYLKRPN